MHYRIALHIIKGAEIYCFSILGAKGKDGAFLMQLPVG